MFGCNFLCNFLDKRKLATRNKNKQWQIMFHSRHPVCFPFSNAKFLRREIKVLNTRNTSQDHLFRLPEPCAKKKKKKSVVKPDCGSNRFKHDDASPAQINQVSLCVCTAEDWKAAQKTTGINIHNIRLVVQTEVTLSSTK